MSTKEALSVLAETLHAHMLEEDSRFFKLEELQTAMALDSSRLLPVLQELMNKNLIKPGKSDGQISFQAVSLVEAEKVGGMTKDEAMIYSHIQGSGREGIWTKAIKAKTNLHQHIVLRCLKALENQRYIKAIKSVKHPTRKIYMLYNLQPSVEVTGGPWFTDSELDTEFIDSLMSIVWRFVASKTFPNAFPTEHKPEYNHTQSSYPAHYNGFPNVSEILDFIISSQITNVELTTTDIRSLCNVLVYDDKLEKVSHRVDQYKATWHSILAAGGGLPVGTDPYAVQEVPFSIFNLHAVVPSNAESEIEGVYLDSWMET
ncbi:hypothetical protein BABINDRAFT_161473 [Babjeviella inositovora NRRL Y-12698]|uniref:DNA-directed RNA polymerase III subunit RPC6 n=1 Tax=Babjeviella inositovora NRRL Y-12698 TaxID=984486 RepID=A0A1E3QQ18_9ASCO|nr:uncharacterized protein BABINDRAFT_161473 [Babjeviella inositovora NRRL Y-12698]ODQ79775.1 hypothetical protein BABINDRAFT_161473 [Babjeviella inositovora NRRL Y-12698]